LTPVAQPASAEEQWTGRKPTLHKHLVEFGRIGHVTLRTKKQAKWNNKSIKMLMVGYAANHSEDTYRMYNPITKKVSETRDVTWLDWHGRENPTHDLELFEKISSNELQHTPDRATPQEDDEDEYEIPDCTTTIPEDEPREDTTPAPRAATTNSEAIQTERTMSTRRIATNLIDVQPGRNVSARQQRELKRLNTSYNRTVDREMKTIEMETADVVYSYNASLQSDPKVPKNYAQAMKGPEAERWWRPIEKEIREFLKRDVWKRMKRSEVPNGRRLLRSRWIFKMKPDPVDTQRSIDKGRLVILGYEMIPGVDFTESFAPLATDTTIRTTLAVSLWRYEQEAEGEWVTEVVDATAAFLNAKLDDLVYIEIPEGLREVLRMDGVEIGDDEVLQLLRAQYGIVQAPRAWMKTFTKILLSIGLVQCMTDPCLFYMRDDELKLVAVVAVYCDDCIITGMKKVVNEIKEAIQKRIEITDLGELKRHLESIMNLGLTDTEGFC
jgi:hypothetical protein